MTAALVVPAVETFVAFAGLVVVLVFEIAGRGTVALLLLLIAMLVFVLMRRLLGR